MDALTQTLMQRSSGDDLSRIGRMIGADEGATSAALSAAVPLLVSALPRNASKPKGANALHQALARDHDGSILSDVSGFLGNPAAANGAGILGHIPGARQPVVQRGLAQNAGLNTGQIGQPLQIAALLLMGALGRQNGGRASTSAALCPS